MTSQDQEQAKAGCGYPEVSVGGIGRQAGRVSWRRQGGAKENRWNSAGPQISVMGKVPLPRSSGVVWGRGADQKNDRRPWLERRRRGLLPPWDLGRKDSKSSVLGQSALRGP